jgi:hypothetical protein
MTQNPVIHRPQLPDQTLQAIPEVSFLYTASSVSAMAETGKW